MTNSPRPRVDGPSSGATAGLPPASDIDRADLGPLAAEPAAGSVVVEERPTPPVHVDVSPRRDQVRWGPIWAGVVTVFATFLLLELAFFAFGWLTLDPGAEDPNQPGLSSSAYVMTGLAGAIAFLLGGFVAGCSASWKSMVSGFVHGALVWAVGITLILVFTLLGGGQLFGAFSGALQELSVIQNALGQGDVNIGGSSLSDARGVAGWAVLTLAVFLVAAALGAAAGAKLWPRRQGDHVEVKS